MIKITINIKYSENNAPKINVTHSKISLSKSSVRENQPSHKIGIGKNAIFMQYYDRHEMHLTQCSTHNGLMADMFICAHVIVMHLATDQLKHHCFCFCSFSIFFFYFERHIPQVHTFSFDGLLFCSFCYFCQYSIVIKRDFPCVKPTNAFSAIPMR